LLGSAPLVGGTGSITATLSTPGAHTITIVLQRGLSQCPQQCHGGAPRDRLSGEVEFRFLNSCSTRADSRSEREKMIHTSASNTRSLGHVVF
jgi:hypothetical protein